jgi:hypothetical protein
LRLLAGPKLSISIDPTEQAACWYCINGQCDETGAARGLNWVQAVFHTWPVQC